MDMQSLLIPVATLAAAYGSQVLIVKRLVAFIKEVTGLDGWKVRLLSFGIGLLSGGLFLWPWIELNPSLPLSVYVLTGTLFLATAGLVASGDYDLKAETAEIEAGVKTGRTPEK